MQNFSKFKLNFGFLTSLIILLIFNLLFQFFPLSGIVGFENSALNSLLLVLIIGILSIRRLRKLNYNSILNFPGKEWKKLTFLIIIPFVFTGIVSLILKECPVGIEALFYPLIVLPAVTFSIFLANLSLLISRKFTLILFFILILITALIPILEIYYYPQIYFYNPLIGFFPGTVYNEFVPISTKLILYEFTILMLSVVGIILTSFVEEKSRFKPIVFIVIIFSFIGFLYLKPYFGFSTNLSKMTSELKNRIETKNFDIYYSAPIDSAELKSLAMEHEYYFNKLENLLETKPEQKIISFVFKNTNQKRELFGAENADVAKPWMNQIYVNYKSYEGTLYHELIHLFSAEFGITPFKIADDFNFAMIEGFATGIENNMDNYPVDFLAKFAYKNGYKVKIENLFKSFNFFAQTSSISYVYAGSFIKYLKNNYGIDPVKKVYGEIDFEKYFGKSISELSNEYEKYLSSIEIEEDTNLAQLYFGQPPVYKKKCLRYVARQMYEARQKMRSKDYKNANEIYEESFNRTEAYRPLRGYVNSLISLKQYKQAENVLDSTITKYSKTSYYFSLKALQGNLAALNQEKDKARRIFNELYYDAPNINYKNYAFTMLKLLEHDEKRLVKSYFLSKPEKRLEILLSLLRNDFYFEAIPLLTDYWDNLNIWDAEMMEQIKTNLQIEKPETAFAAMKLSTYAIKNLKFDYALFFAELPQKVDKNNYLYQIVKENFEKVSWLRNHQDLEITVFEKAKVN